MDRKKLNAEKICLANLRTRPSETPLNDVDRSTSYRECESSSKTKHRNPPSKLGAAFWLWFWFWFWLWFPPLCTNASSMETTLGCPSVVVAAAARPPVLSPPSSNAGACPPNALKISSSFAACA